MKADWLNKQGSKWAEHWRRPAAWLVLAACACLPLGGWWLHSSLQSSRDTAAQREAAAAANTAITNAEVTAASDVTVSDAIVSDVTANDLNYDAFVQRHLARQQYQPSFVPVPPPYIEHVVSEGENIWLIALEYGTDMESIAAINDISVTDVLRPGQTLRVLVGTEGIIHTVAAGDTIEGLAERYDIREDAIRAANNLRSDTLIVGQELVLPGARLQQRRTATVASVSRGSTGGSSGSGTALSGFIWPHYGLITSYYGWRDSGFHTGIDIDGNTGDPIVAAKAGTVTHSGWGWSGFGIYVVIDHGDGTKTIYAHLNEAYVEEGAYVEQGEVIGALGSTGWSTGPHLHFEILVDGVEVDPLPSLP